MKKTSDKKDQTNRAPFRPISRDALAYITGGGDGDKPLVKWGGALSTGL